MGYGELYLPPVIKSDRDLTNGHFIKNMTPHNKGKKWSEWMSEKGAKKVMDALSATWGCKKPPRPDVVERCAKACVAVFDDGSWTVFESAQDAARHIGGNGSNLRRCCRRNQERRETQRVWGHVKGVINTDHKYMGIRFYYETDTQWMTKVKQL